MMHHLWQWLQRVEVDPAHAMDSLPLDVLSRKGPDLEDWFVVDGQGRLHTPLTALRRDHRAHVRVDGKPLVQLDLSHCQPLLVIAYLLDLERRGKNGDIDKEKRGSRGDGAITTLYVDKIPSSEVSDYVSLCQSGTLYSVLADATGLTRDVAKNQFIQAIYNRPTKVHIYPAGLAFRERFPSLWAAIAALNGVEHGALPRAMQRLESDIVIGLACGRIARERPTCPS